MSPNAEFLAYAHDKFNVDLPPSLVWSDVGKLNWDQRAPQDFVRTFVDNYPNLVSMHPEFPEVARPLFFAIVKHGASQPSTQHWWTEQIADALRLWTKNGVRDMSAQEADTLAPLLRPRLRYGGQSPYKIATMVYASAMLWERMGPETLNAGDVQSGSSRKDVGSSMASLLHRCLLHRYRPQETELDERDTYNAYACMCGIFEELRPSMSEIGGVLMPLHHNTKAWSVAVSFCTPPEAGHWADLDAAFGTLPLRPDDFDAWVILSYLHTYAQTDASCAKLVQSLDAANPELAKAWLDIWPAVSSLYTGNECFSAAVELWKTGPRPLEAVELPSLSLD